MGEYEILCLLNLTVVIVCFFFQCKNYKIKAEFYYQIVYICVTITLSAREPSLYVRIWRLQASDSPRWKT